MWIWESFIWLFFPSIAYYLPGDIRTLGLHWSFFLTTLKNCIFFIFNSQENLFLAILFFCPETNPLLEAVFKENKCTFEMHPFIFTNWKTVSATSHYLLYRFFYWWYTKPNTHWSWKTWKMKTWTWKSWREGNEGFFKGNHSSIGIPTQEGKQNLSTAMDVCSTNIVL